VPTIFTVNSLADLSIAAGVNAATGAINGTNNVTVRSAIQAANATPGGNTINLALPGTYAIALAGTAGETDNAEGEFAILPGGGDLTIQNTSAGAVVLDANHLGRVLDINPAFDPANPTPKFLVTLDGLTIQNGLATDAANPDGPNASGGGIRDNGNASLTLNNVVVTANTASADGGGVVFENTVSVPWTFTANGSTIIHNHAGDAGGGVDADGSGKIFINAGTLIADNTCVNQGAGIWLDAIQVGNIFQTANLTVTGAVISGNKAQSGVGGGIGNAGDGTVTLTNATIANNSTGATGGGFGDANAQSTLVVQNSLIQDNFAFAGGGGIVVSSPTTTITSSEIDNNSTLQAGGGILANGTTLTVLDSTLAGNTSGGTGGGGLEIDTTGTGAAASSVTNTTLFGNDALNAGTTTIGGGVALGSAGAYSGTTTFLNDTINGNYASSGGGAAVAAAATGSVSFENTIVAGNRTPTTDPDYQPLAGHVSSQGGNLIGNNNGDAFFNQNSDQSGVDPLLGPLQNNGGPIAGAAGSSQVLSTEALMASSKAVGKGIAAGVTAADERGFNRVAGRVDVGAVEFQPLSSSIGLVSSANPATFHQPVSIVATVAGVPAGSNVAPSGSVTFTLDGVAQAPVALVDGAATFNVPTTWAVGAHSVAVSYGGDNTFTGSTQSLTETVSPVATTTALTSSANPVLAGQPATFTATIGSQVPGAGTPGGSVTFTVDGQARAPVPAVNGVATFTVTGLAPGTHTVVATSSGDGTFAGSSQTLTETVSQAATTTTLASSVNPVLLGQPVTFTATVNSQVPGAGTPAGSVVFTVDGTPQASAPLTGGVATFTATGLPAGPHTVTATYSGNTTFTGSTGAVTETVSGLEDVTGLVRITPVQPQSVRRGRRVRTNRSQPTFQITNTSGATIQGPVYLVVDGLTGGAMLQNATGVSQTHVRAGDPFILISPNGLGAGQSVNVTLMFNAASRRQRMLLAQVGPHFSSFVVLAGPGTV
jgi:hypothetical protein